MARTVGILRLCLALVVVAIGVVGFGPPGGAGPPTGSRGIGTPLPSKWELCVLQGVGGPGTPANVANLDAWQVAEGGSTDNTAAYNPFNTRQATDQKGTPLPLSASSGTFPAFTTWEAGCAATVATLLQPIMAPVVTALRAGNVAPPGLFLYDVDKTAWCAPSADGLPCYASQILAAELLGALLNGLPSGLTDALTSYSETNADLSSYKKVAFVVAVDQQVLAARAQQLALINDEVSVAQSQASAAAAALRGLALDNYTHDGATRSDANLQMFGPPDERGVISDYYGNLASTTLIDRYNQAQAELQSAVARQTTAAAAVTEATSELASVQSSESGVLVRLEADMKAIEAAKSCSPQPLVTTAAVPVVQQPQSATQLWGALQTCLAPSPPAGVTPTRR